MGMFDTIYCRRPLPDDGTSDQGFQTKSLHSVLCVYEIGSDGRLRELELDDTGQPLPDKSRDTGFHGVMRFYTYIGDRRMEYEAKFTDGLVVDLRSANEACYDERGMLMEKGS